MAKEEARLRLSGVQTINTSLATFMPSRTFEAIKGQRRQARYKALVNTYLVAESRTHGDIMIPAREENSSTDVLPNTNNRSPQETGISPRDPNTEVSKAWSPSAPRMKTNMNERLNDTHSPVHDTQGINTPSHGHILPIEPVLNDSLLIDSLLNDSSKHANDWKTPVKEAIYTNAYAANISA
ncbi:MAG: hypothetical protein M3H12_01055, partial [Chromatiales bacterium]